MKIEKLVTYNWKHLEELPEGKERNYIAQAIHNLEYLKERIAEEEKASVNLGTVTATFQGFANKDLETEVSKVIFDTLYQ